MKKLIILLTISFFSTRSMYAQNINWRWIDDEKPNHAHLMVGYDFGVTTQFGYSRALNVIKPALLTVDYSMPMGNVIFDDFKIRFGGQAAIAEWGNFITSVKLFGNFKRYETELVRMYGFGIEPAILLGYYKSGWHAALELGMIKPFQLNLKHTETFKESYSAVEDGWYKSSGGYLNYGLQGNKTIGANLDISLRIGLTNAFGDDKDATLPYYGQLGIMKRF